MSDLQRRPGYLGFTSRGVIAIHADWPVYPVEHGPAVAIVSMCAFPEHSDLLFADDIDGCILFAVAPLVSQSDLFDERNFHVAVWHEDLLELSRQGWVHGISAITEAERIRRQSEMAKNWYLKRPDGQFERVQLPDPDDYDDEIESIADVTGDHARITAAGWTEVHRLITQSGDILKPQLGVRVTPLLEIGRYDSAIRDGCIMVETRLRELTGKHQHGQRLVDAFFDPLLASDEYPSASLKTFRGEVRTAFKFVRNEYAHNLREITAEQCWAILWRLSNILDALDSLSADAG
jgi:hypothetical protein